MRAPSAEQVRTLTLLARVVQLLQEAERPLRATEIRQGLGRDGSVNQQLSTLVRRQVLEREAGRYRLRRRDDAAHEEDRRH